MISKKYVETAVITSIPAAQDAVRKFMKQYYNAKNREEQLAVKRKLVFFANRADAMSRRRGIQKEVKDKFKEVSKIYRDAHKRIEVDEIQAQIDRSIY